MIIEIHTDGKRFVEDKILDRVDYFKSRAKEINADKNVSDKDKLNHIMKLLDMLET